MDRWQNSAATVEKARLIRYMDDNVETSLYVIRRGVLYSEKDYRDYLIKMAVNYFKSLEKNFGAENQ